MSRTLPILFNTEMVRAILDGRKTVTRRVIKPRYRDDESGFQVITRMNGEFVRVEKVDENECGIFADGTERHVNPPYEPGDILYVREAFCPYDSGHVIDGVKYAYRANATPDSERQRKEYGYKWTPSIHMPKEAARIWLKVTAVRAERLRDITEEQARAEGFTDKTHLIDTFLKLYPECSLETWLWVYEFERCEKPK